ncbi:sucrase ferredoxin domain-containing protein [Apiospora rasikravindrae]|uniref:Defect at low temperature protein 1 n=1 Tax=Apiospora rasikravindrae TaxID=990691 RepID=A0ABR1SW10_9PEZI
MAQSKAKLHTAFRIFYNSLYFLFQLVLLALLLAVPGDIIRQAYLYTFQYANIIIISGVYLLSVIIVLFVYFLRLYITRTVLAGIPRSTTPIGKGDVKKQVRQMIAKDLGRSAAIAWEARPKVTGPNANPRTLGIVPEEDNEYEQQSNEKAEGDFGGQKLRRSTFTWATLKKSPTVESKMGIALPPTKPVWGEIEHNGWGSPNSPDLPNLQYSTVLSELPNLIEAKAVSQAPVDRNASPEQPAFDPEAVSMLQRAVHMGLRDYVLHLTSLGVIPSTQTVSDFLDAYERGRFSPKPMSNAAFRNLMHLFAEVLRNMQPLDPSTLNVMNDLDMNSMYTDSRSNIDDDAPRESSPTTPGGGSIHSMASSSSLRTPVSRSSPRVLPKQTAMLQRTSSVNSWAQYGTAPSTPMSLAGPRAYMTPGTGGGGGGTLRLQRTISSRTSSTNSGNSFAQTRPPYNGANNYSSDGSSLRRTASQQSGGSVIRLARREDGVDLPYVLRIGDSF